MRGFFNAHKNEVDHDADRTDSNSPPLLRQDCEEALSKNFFRRQDSPIRRQTRRPTKSPARSAAQTTGPRIDMRLMIIRVRCRPGLMRTFAEVLSIPIDEVKTFMFAIVS